MAASWCLSIPTQRATSLQPTSQWKVITLVKINDGSTKFPKSELYKVQPCSLKITWGYSQGFQVSFLYSVTGSISMGQFSSIHKAILCLILKVKQLHHWFVGLIAPSNFGSDSLLGFLKRHQRLLCNSMETSFLVTQPLFLCLDIEGNPL